MILTCHDLTKSFIDNTVIENASFGLEDHEKAAIVGINGAGKSTLLRIITGELHADSGIVSMPKNVRLGYLAQQEMLPGDGTVWDAMADARKDIFEAEEKLRGMEESMKTLTGADLDEAMRQYHLLHSWFERENGYAVRSEITGILRGLGFSQDDFYRSSSDLSGGQRTRVALGRLLLSSPDLILLDEPTNHLDMNSITWLENYLHAYEGAVLIVAHDRYFLDRVVSKVIEIDQGEVCVFKGNYSEYARQKKIQREARLKAWQKQQDQIAHQQEVITKLRSFNREKSIKRAESREKLLRKMTPLQRPVSAASEMNLRLQTEKQSGRDVLMIDNLSKAYGDNVLFRDISLLIRRGEKVALIGDNGVGKTTLLKIVDGLVQADEGSIKLGTNVTVGYYDQDHRILHADKTLFDEISDAWPELNQSQIRNLLAAFLFTGDDVFKLTGQLSGGERGRLSLARLMLSGANLLLLDEPTNHLDMVSREILEDALSDYDGTVFYVSHDRYFINRTATRVIEMSSETIVPYEGNYDYYLEKKEQLSLKEAGNPKADHNEPASGQGDSKAKWLEAKQLQAQKRRLKAQLERTEDEIAGWENILDEIDNELVQEKNTSDPEALMKLSQKRQDAEAELAKLYGSWEQLMQEVEESET